jgi:mono/diheme cytochrome c family protein
LHKAVFRFCVTAAVLGSLLGVPAHAVGAEAAERGAYIFNAAGCAGCHTDVRTKGPLLAGRRELVTPFGSFYSPNITPDPIHGIGSWSQADFAMALRQGKSPSGTLYYPSFPYTSFTGMSDTDVADLWIFISARRSIAQSNEQHKLRFPFNLRVLMWVWRALFFAEGPIEGDAARSKEWNRGAYLVRALAHCGECHTPRNVFGAVDYGRELGGNPVGPDGKAVPNITPGSAVGSWSAEEIADYLSIGMTPEGDFAGGAMTEIINLTTSKLSDADRFAVATFLIALPPVRQFPAKP